MIIYKRLQKLLIRSLNKACSISCLVNKLFIYCSLLLLFILFIVHYTGVHYYNKALSYLYLTLRVFHDVPRLCQHVYHREGYGVLPGTVGRGLGGGGAGHRRKGRGEGWRPEVTMLQRLGTKF